MTPETAAKLIALNRQFYQRFAEPFSATRLRVQPGVLRILKKIPKDANILDLGCGNGEVWRVLQEQGHQGLYTGLDFSEGLLKAARMENQGETGQFIQRDLTTDAWNTGLSEPFDVIFAFATLHHLPGKNLHHKIYAKVYKLLSPGGQFFLSNWQFLNSPRWIARIQPWELAGLSQAEVDPGDYLLDWRRGGTGYRYVHHFSSEELIHLADGAGFQIVEIFYSDGKEGNLGLYQVLCI